MTENQLAAKQKKWMLTVFATICPETVVPRVNSHVPSASATLTVPSQISSACLFFLFLSWGGSPGSMHSETEEGTWLNFQKCREITPHGDNIPSIDASNTNAMSCLSLSTHDKVWPLSQLQTGSFLRLFTVKDVCLNSLMQPCDPWFFLDCNPIQSLCTPRTTL